MDVVALTITFRLAAITMLMSPLAAGTLFAQETRQFQVEGGPLSTSISSISRQAAISISVTDARLWSLSVRPVSGKMSVEQALRKWLQGSGARAIRVTSTSWRIVPAPTMARRPHPPRRTAHASDAPRHNAAIAPPVEDIVVTGTKAQIPYSHFAGTATLIDADDMEFGQERGMDAIMRHTASLSSTHFGSGRNKLFIRGIADSSFTGPTQSTVGQYLGDLRLSYNAPDPDLRLYDLDGVEVIEGPQGTLYGAGSMGGIIRMVPRAPDGDAMEIRAIAGGSITQHGKPGGDIAAITNIPLSDPNTGQGHALRAVGYMMSEGGYIDNDLLGQRDVNRTQIRGGRATLRLVPSDRLLVDIGGIYQHIRADDAQYADRGTDLLSRSSPITQGSNAHYAMANLVLTREMGDYELRSSHGYVQHDLDERFDASEDSQSPKALNQWNRTRMWVSETRLSRPFYDNLGWVIGASFIHNQARQQRETESRSLRVPVTGVRNDVNEWTAFGNVTYAITPDLVASGGLRLSHSKLNGSGEDITQPESTASRAMAASRTETDLLPTASLIHTMGPSLRVYISYAQGFRPGGLAIDRNSVRRFRHDRVETWEAGVRFGDLLMRPIDASLSISHNRWRDIQADFIDGNGFPTTANIGDGRITSLSASLAVRVTPQLTMELSGIYNHSRVDTLSPEANGLLVQMAERHAQSLPLGVALTTPPSIFTDNSQPTDTMRIPNVASHSLRAAVTYATNVGDQDLRFNGWAQYVGPSHLGVGPVLGQKQGNYVDGGVAMRYGNEKRAFTVTLTNPLDARGNRFALGTPFRDTDRGFVTPLRPRTLRISVEMAY